MPTPKSINKKIRSLFEENKDAIIAAKTNPKTKKISKISLVESNKFAMKETLQDAMEKYPDSCPSILWKTLQEVYVDLGTDGLTLEQVRQAKSVDQSWNKSSGHAFEEFICSYYNDELLKNNVKLILKKELSSLVKNGLIHNDSEDMPVIQNWLKQSSFDIFVTFSDNNETKVFGTIESKTSIRERVLKDRETALQSMEENYWATIIVLDGDFLKNQKFQDMVNGDGDNDSTFKLNGWHGMYVFSEISENKRIYNCDSFIEHCLEAKTRWVQKRNRLKRDWQAE